MSGQTSATLLRSINYRVHLMPFMESTGWHSTNEGNSRWTVWNHAPEYGDSQAYELVFPSQGSEEERRGYVSKAIDFLSAFYDETADRVILRVLNFDRDLLFLRNLDTTLEQLIPLDRAVEQIANFKQMILHAISAEREPRPFVQQVSDGDRNVVKEYSFGHTMPGSFVFSVSTPRLRVQPEPHAQGSFLPGSDLPVARPVARRVSERIARGLQLAEGVDPGLLVHEYGRAFNANMCLSLAEVAGKGDNAVEVQIAWSPRLPVSSDVADFKAMRISKTTCDALAIAAEKLKEVKPEAAVVVGFVSGLNTDDDPGLDFAQREVYLKAPNPVTRRTVKFLVSLNRGDYTKAIDAHERWVQVRITGIPIQTSEGWRLERPSELTVLG